jgi:sulfate/thiosulfate transport system permease protein
MSAAEKDLEKRVLQASTGKSWGPAILIGLVFLYVGVIILLPICGLILETFRNGAAGVITSLADPRALEAIGRTVGIALAVTVVHALFGLIAAWVFVRHRFPGRAFLIALVDLPFAISPVVVGYMLLLLFGREGLLAPLLNALQLKVAFALPGMVLATLFVTLPFMIREMIPVLKDVSLQQEFAAATLGAKPWQVFWKITFPALRWGILYGAILTFARALGEFGAVLVIGGGVQGLTETATIYIYHALDARQYVSAYSVALVLGLSSMALVTISDLMRKR